MPGPGCAAPPAKIQPADLAAAVRRLERAEQPAVARQPVDGAVEHAVAVVDVLRRQGPLEHDAVLEVGHARRALELVEDHPPVVRQHGVPVVVRPQVRRVDEDVERLAAGRRDAGLGAGRRGEIAGRVRGRLAAAVDPVELLLGVAREDEVVVQQVLVAAVQAEVEHDARAGRFATSATARSWPRARRQQFVVRAHRVHVGDDGAERDALAVVGLEPLHTAVARSAAGARRRRSGSPRRAARPAARAPRARRGCRRSGTRRPRRLHVRDAAQHRRRRRRATSRRTA